jgi:uncharacterized membrane protein YfcA
VQRPLGAQGILLNHINPVHLRFGVGVLLVLYTVYGLARPAFKPMKIGVGPDIAIGIVNGLVGGLTGLGGVMSTISCQWRGWTRDVQRAVFQPVLFAAFVVISISMGITGAIMLAGLWSGFKLYGTINDETFRKSVLMLLLLAGLSLIVLALMFRGPDTGLAGTLSPD